MMKEEIRMLALKTLTRFNLYRTKKIELTQDLVSEWERMFGLFLEEHTADDIQKAADVCVVRLSHFPTPKDLFNYFPKEEGKEGESAAWKDKTVAEYRSAMFGYSDFYSQAYGRAGEDAQGRCNEIISDCKCNNVNPYKALNALSVILLKPQFLTEKSTANTREQTH